MTELSCYSFLLKGGERSSRGYLKRPTYCLVGEHFVGWTPVRSPRKKKKDPRRGETDSGLQSRRNWKKIRGVTKMGSSEYLMKVQNLNNTEIAGISQPQTLAQKLRYELEVEQVRKPTGLTLPFSSLDKRQCC